jgi:hypothetical protein
MAPQLDAAQYILIKTLLEQGFETKLTASEALCSVRAVQRFRLQRFRVSYDYGVATNLIRCCTAYCILIETLLKNWFETELL